MEVLTALVHLAVLLFAGCCVLELVIGTGLSRSLTGSSFRLWRPSRSSECKITCGKAKVMIDEGIPAVTFEPLAKEYAEVCEKK